MQKCKECAAQISTKADVCPQCGAKAPKKTSVFTWFVLILIIFGVWGAATSPPSTSVAAQSSGSESTSSRKTNQDIANPPSDSSRPSKVKRQVPPSAWQTTQSRDEMTGKRSSYATSRSVTPKTPMDFPYHDTTAWLGVGCDKGSEWAYIGFSKAPNLNDTKTGDGYNLISTRFKWNNSVQKIQLTQKWGAAFIHFENDAEAISKMASASVAVLELDWHGQRPVHFEFPLTGSSAAISKIRAECAQF